jgi:hypothetical protein
MRRTGWPEERPVSIPNDPELTTDLTSLHYSYRGGALLIESKEDAAERGIKSPDRADSLTLTFAEPVSPSIYSRAPKRRGSWRTARRPTMILSENGKPRAGGRRRARLEAVPQGRCARDLPVGQRRAVHVPVRGRGQPEPRCVRDRAVGAAQVHGQQGLSDALSRDGDGRHRQAARLHAGQGHLHAHRRRHRRWCARPGAHAADAEGGA